MKSSYIVFVLVLLLAGPSFAQKSKLSEKREKQITQRIKEYESFLELTQEKSDSIYALYTERFIRKHKVHNATKNDTTLSVYEKKKMKKKVEKEIDMKLMELLTFEEYIHIKCHHQTLIRLSQIEFITPLNEQQYQKLLNAMREMRYRNVMVVKKNGKMNEDAKEEMIQNRLICASIEKEVFTAEMYTHLHNLHLLTVADWSKGLEARQGQEISRILEGYNILEPVNSYR